MALGRDDQIVAVCMRHITCVSVLACSVFLPRFCRDAPCQIAMYHVGQWLGCFCPAARPLTHSGQLSSIGQPLTSLSQPITSIGQTTTQLYWQPLTCIGQSPHFIPLFQTPHFSNPSLLPCISQTPHFYLPGQTAPCWTVLGRVGHRARLGRVAVSA